MTLDGVVTKTLLMMGSVLLGVIVGGNYLHEALIARDLVPSTPSILYITFSVPAFWPGLFAVLLALIGSVAWWFEAARPYLAPVFAFVQGMCIASLAAATEHRYPGLAAMAALATGGLLAVLLGMHYYGWVSDASPLALGAAAAFVTMAAGGAVTLLIHLANPAKAMPQQSTIVYWGILCGFMILLAQQLAQSFAYIEEGIEMGAPKRMEWQAAFGLMVELVFIYVTILDFLRQVARSQSSRS